MSAVAAVVVIVIFAVAVAAACITIVALDVKNLHNECTYSPYTFDLSCIF